MGILLFLLSLLVTMARGGPYAALAMEMKGTMVPYYASTSELNAYWQSVFPKAPIPSPILDRFSAPSGSMINLYIGRANNARPLRRDIADLVPMSTKNFTAIIAMFAPVSFSMARDMWSTLNSCEHPREVAGEQKACATSIESMHEFAASVLGTRDLHGISSPSRMYKMVVVRVAHGGGEASVVTCHSMSFPFAVFYCHAVNPTRIYEVTMQIEENNNVTVDVAENGASVGSVPPRHIGV
ncbi:unnamed protein product [Miscanthus lutarioriparius]|uniref:BURP domain-containing protein n=1 Tax=Miscanthus lutarioriparius TaxID=422564 RepID=A0A811MR54_9POAL|nr:unnamed protein product [Miscanthus lutarioriparius]